MDAYKTLKNAWQLMLQPWQVCMFWQSTFPPSSQQSGTAWSEEDVVMTDFAGQLGADSSVLAST